MIWRMSLISGCLSVTENTSGGDDISQFKINLLLAEHFVCISLVSETTFVRCTFTRPQKCNHCAESGV